MANKKPVRILSLDGGGIRGIIPSTIIKYAEEYLQKKAPGTTIADHFDFIAGTSTGGILTCIYLTPQEKDRTKAKFSAAEALDFYVKEGYNIFNASKLSNWQRIWGMKDATGYSPKCIEGLFRKKFKDTLLSELIKPCLITTYNMDIKSSFFFTSNSNVETREFYVRDVARSTSAAPTYFPPANIKNIATNSGADGDPVNMINIDGGVFANNPLMCAFAEVRRMNFEERNNSQPSASQMQILSLGTGGGRFALDHLNDSANWSLMRWAKSIPNIMMDGSVDTVTFQMNEIFKTLHPDDPGTYLRVDVPENEKNYALDMADASPENIEALQKAGEKTLEYAKINGLHAFLDGLLN